MWKSWVLSVSPELDESPILEIGHGPGHLLHHLGGSGSVAIGLDASRHMGRIAYRRLSGLVLSPLLVNGYAQFLPFPRNTFRRIVATFPSEYIFDASTLREITRVMADDGEFICLPAAWITGKNIFHRAAAFLFKITHQVPGTMARLEKSAKELLEPHGFSVILEYRTIGNSQVLIIKCRKQG